MKPGRIITSIVVGVLLSVGLTTSGVVQAATDESNDDSKTSTDVKEATGNGSVMGYAATSKLQYGTIVKLTDKGAKQVTPTDNKDLSKMYGVTVDPHALSVTISDSSLTNQVYVATSGTFNVLVSTQAGTIKPGDYVTMSAIEGVAMKAGTYQEQAMVFGRAASGFDGKSNSMGTVTLKYDRGSETATVQLGLIPVAINIQKNPNDKSTKANLPPILEKIGKEIAQKEVSPVRIYLAIGVTGMSIMVALVTLYSGIRNAIISIGRNPLSKKSIFRGLLEIILTGFLILIIGLFAVYLLLKL